MNHRGQFSITNLAVWLIVFFITATFYPVIASFVTLVTGNADVPESGRGIFGLIPAFIAATLIATLFAYSQARRE